MVCTADKYTEDEAVNEYGIVESSKVGMAKDIQTVVAINERSELLGIKEGDKVLLNFNRYAVFKDKKDSIKSGFDEHYNTIIRYDFPTLMLDNQEHLLLDTSDVIVVILEQKEVDVVPKSNLILEGVSNLIK